MSDITVRELVRDTKAVLDRVEAGETIRIKGRTVVLTAMGQAVAPDITKPVVEKTAALDPNAMTPEEELDDLDDWGLPVEPFPAGMEMGTSKQPADPDLATRRQMAKPQWKPQIGLSKSQQAGGKYER